MNSGAFHSLAFLPASAPLKYYTNWRWMIEEEHFPFCEKTKWPQCSGIVTSKYGRCWTGNESPHPPLLMSKHTNVPKETRWLCPGPLPGLMSRTQLTSLIPTVWLQFPDASFCPQVSQSPGGAQAGSPEAVAASLRGEAHSLEKSSLCLQGFHTAN